MKSTKIRRKIRLTNVLNLIRPNKNRYPPPPKKKGIPMNGAPPWMSGFGRWDAARAQLGTAAIGLVGAMTALGANEAEGAAEGGFASLILPFTAGGFLHIALVTGIDRLVFSAPAARWTRFATPSLESPKRLLLVSKKKTDPQFLVILDKENDFQDLQRNIYTT